MHQPVQHGQVESFYTRHTGQHMSLTETWVYHLRWLIMTKHPGFKGVPCLALLTFHCPVASTLPPSRPLRYLVFTLKAPLSSLNDKCCTNWPSKWNTVFCPYHIWANHSHPEVIYYMTPASSSPPPRKLFLPHLNVHSPSPWTVASPSNLCDGNLCIHLLSSLREGQAWFIPKILA